MKRVMRISCDAPGCTRTITVDGREHGPVVPAWLTVHRLAAVEAGTPVYAEAPLYDFCSVACLRAFLELVHRGEGPGAWRHAPVDPALLSLERARASSWTARRALCGSLSQDSIAIAALPPPSSARRIALGVDRLQAML